MDTPAEFYTARAVMPPSYLAAKASLRVAARHFTPETYFAATTALERAVVEFERETDTHPLPVAAQTYGRIADDQELARLIRAVERARRKWLAAN